MKKQLKKQVRKKKKRASQLKVKDENYNFASIEAKWQKKWEDKKIFQASEDSKKKKFYVLDMFPYPSGAGLHMGHAFVYTVGDINARLNFMKGFNVLHPIGFDSLGLPAENAAIKVGIHPKKYTENAIKNFIIQQKAMGWSYDWSRMIRSHDSSYYKWDQWIFLQMFKKGLAFRKKSAVNWCPSCKTVLANEQAQGGICERCKTHLEIKHLEQWFFKITDYADELYNDIEKLKGWPEDIKAMQRNWIGKSHGVDIDFIINGEKWSVFTTRPDTIYGVTFMVISAQHPRLMEIVTEKQKEEVDALLKKIKSTSEKDMEELEKEGAFTGSYAINPITKEKIPVYAGNFVVADYGCGMVMAVPAHDQRDFEFAKKYKIPVKVVINPETYELNAEKMSRAYTAEGTLVNSGQFNNMNSREAIEIISDYVENNKLGKKAVNYKLRDWLISRQRYWGTPIPIIYCDNCGIVPVPEDKLPVELPEKVKFGEGNPLEKAKKWIKVKCPKCKGEGKRETDTMDTFVNSSWYFLRYCDSKNSKEIFGKKKAEYWMPINQYVGGREHACMHLIYFRFYTKFLRDLELIKFDEPAEKLFNQGMIYGSDGAVMSKSRGNIVDPFDMIKKYGADTLRFYLVSNASSDKDFVWSDSAIEGSFKFVRKVFDYFSNFKPEKSSERIESKLNKTIKQASGDIENFRFNLAVIKIRELFETIEEENISRKDAECFLKLISVFCPHIAEKLWHKFGNKSFISLESWPKADEKKINEKFEQQEKAQEKLINDINNILKIMKEKQGKEANKIFIYTISNEKEAYNKEEIERRTGRKVEIYAVNDKNKHDPENKSSKAKPGKPGIYVE